MEGLKWRVQGFKIGALKFERLRDERQWCRVECVACRLQDAWLRVQGLTSRVGGSGLRVDLALEGAKLRIERRGLPRVWDLRG